MCYTRAHKNPLEKSIKVAKSPIGRSGGARAGVGRVFFGCCVPVHEVQEAQSMSTYSVLLVFLCATLSKVLVKMGTNASL